MAYPKRSAPHPLRGRDLAALRAVALHPGGLRLAAYPSATPVLVGLGLVVRRPARFASARQGEEAWFLTEAGRRALKALGRDREE